MAISNSVILSMLANGASEDEVMAYVQANGTQAKAKPAKPRKITTQATQLEASSKSKNKAKAKSRYGCEFGTLYFDSPLPSGSTITITVK